MYASRAVLCLRVWHCLSVYLCVRVYLCLLYVGLTCLWLYACSTCITLHWCGGVVSAKTPEFRPGAVPDSGEEDQHPGDEEHSGEKEQPRRSRRQRKKICYQPFAQRKSKQKQKSQAK